MLVRVTLILQKEKAIHDSLIQPKKFDFGSKEGEACGEGAHQHYFHSAGHCC